MDSAPQRRRNLIQGAGRIRKSETVLIGVMSDTHGQARITQRALALFDRLEVEHIVHCGDVGGEEVFDELVGRPCTFVWGNTDRRPAPLLAYLHGVGLTVPTEVPTRIKLGGKRFAVFHGHEEGFEAAVRSLDVDFILHGHSHARRDEVVHGKRVINPGALHRAIRHSVAVLNTDTEDVAFHNV